MDDQSWNTPYIHGTDQEVDEISPKDTFDTVFTVYIGNKKNVFTPEEFLLACWTVGFDTSCAICRKSFELATEPPVRLLGLGQHMEAPDPLTKELPPISVNNYHLRCLQANQVKFVPVSHPWHPSIAEAYALRIFNAKAAQTCYEVPARTLLAVIRRFRSDCLLWHDYISIPQWQDEFRGTVILPQIFKIFEASGCAILHLGHHPPAEVVRMPTIGMINKHNSGLKRFFDAHLFSRLWPIVEFDRAGEAYIMNNEYEIMEPKFSMFVKKLLSAVNASAATMSCDRMSSSQWIFSLPLFVQERQKNKCLGYVYDMIADQGCRSFRDKFIGAAELLQISDYPTELPADSQDACLWLTERQITDNDISPLLLKPSTESIYDKASWLKGHKSLIGNMWGWGVQTHSSAGLARVQDHSVHLHLNLVGTITNEFSWEQQADNPRCNISDDLSDLINSAGGKTKAFGQGLKNIDPFRILHSPHQSLTSGFPVLQFDTSASKLLDAALSRLLEQYVERTGEEERMGSATLHDAIISLLALSASKPAPTLESFAKLDTAQLCRQLCDPSETTLISVSCPSCHKASLFRVNIWEKPTNDARLYLIPGLAYQYTVPNGTGIIVEKDRIIGRARFCSLVCSCNRSAPVKLS
jgi:hypothetical protein